jgi:hypothetical protein
MKKRANPRAGGGYLHSTVGKHTRNPGYIAGEHWVTCQRCDIDYYSRDILREWNGAIVCRSCWEPRHPQDFVRTRAERIQAPGPLNGTGAGLGQPFAVGSTSPPPPTFNLGDITIGTIPNQSDNAGSTISTITGAVFQASFTDTFGATVTIANYSGGFPTGISINASTGDITGTLGGETYLDSGCVHTVYATYSNGQIFGSSFIWFIADAGIHPEDITGSCQGGWYDFSEDEGNWADEIGGTLVVNGGDIMETENKFFPGNASKILNPYTGDVTHAPTFLLNQHNGLASAIFDDASEQHTLEGGAALQHCSNPPFEAFVVCQIPSDFTNTSGLWSSTNANGNKYYVDNTAGGSNGNLHSTFNDELWADINNVTEVGTSWSAYSGDYVLIYAKFDDLGSCDYQVNGDEWTAAEDLTHDNNPEPPFAIGNHALRIGSGVAATGSAYLGPSGPWLANIGEFICFGNSVSYNNEGSLSTDEVAGLSNWLMSKWGISEEIAV